MVNVSNVVILKHILHEMKSPLRSAALTFIYCAIQTFQFTLPIQINFAEAELYCSGKI